MCITGLICEVKDRQQHSTGMSKLHNDEDARCAWGMCSIELSIINFISPLLMVHNHNILYNVTQS